MKLKVVFEVGQWEELEDHWVFNENNGESMIILVEEDISFVGFVEKSYAKIGVSKDTFDVSLSYLPHLIRKTSPIFIMTNEDIEIFFEEMNERIYKISLKVIVIIRGGTINEDSDNNSDDAKGDTRFHDT